MAIRWGGLLGRRYGRHRYGHAATTVAEWESALRKDEADLYHTRRCLAILEAGGRLESEPYMTIAGARGAIHGLEGAIRNKKNLLKARRP